MIADLTRETSSHRNVITATYYIFKGTMLPGYGGVGIQKKDSPFASSIPKSMRLKQKAMRQKGILLIT